MIMDKGNHNLLPNIFGSKSLVIYSLEKAWRAMVHVTFLSNFFSSALVVTGGFLFMVGVKETLIVWGEEDKVFPVYLAYQLQRYLLSQMALIS